MSRAADSRCPGERVHVARTRSLDALSKDLFFEEPCPATISGPQRPSGYHHLTQFHELSGQNVPGLELVSAAPGVRRCYRA